jgi:hypothetical protein
MIILLKLKLPLEIINNIVNYNHYLHKQNIRKVKQFNNVLKTMPKINYVNISKPYIIICPNISFKNYKLVKFIYKLNKKNIKAYSFVNKNITPKDLIKLYNLN